MLEREDAATIWEYYDPAVRDMRRFASSLEINFDWLTSLCHGWGAGAVPLTAELLLGITHTKPGFCEINLNTGVKLKWAYQAKVPTPFGSIIVEKSKNDGPPLQNSKRNFSPDRGNSQIKFHDGVIASVRFPYDLCKIRSLEIKGVFPGTGKNMKYN